MSVTNYVPTYTLICGSKSPNNIQVHCMFLPQRQNITCSECNMPEVHLCTQPSEMEDMSPHAHK